MTLDEAIEHAIQIADSYKDTAPDCDYVKDQRQLAEWLKKVRVYEKVKKRSASMIRELKAENAKLSTQLTDVTESMGRMEERCAKLRELVLEVWRSCPVDEDDCKKCPHSIVESDEVWCDIPIRMSELGIEVG